LKMAKILETAPPCDKVGTAVTISQPFLPNSLLFSSRDSAIGAVWSSPPTLSPVGVIVKILYE